MIAKLMILLFSVLPIICGCTIRPPDVIITSEKTALENQLLGTDEKISDDPVSVTAVWSRDFSLDLSSYYEDGRKPVVDESGSRKLIIAQIRRQTLQDHIDQLKRSGIIGEKNNGFIAAMSDTIGAYEEIERLMAAENSDRAIIWEFYAMTSGADPQQTLLSVRKDFSAIMAKTSPTGTWIEDQEGNWARK